MPNQLNKNKNKNKQNNNDIHATQRALILTQQVEQQQRLRQLADEYNGGVTEVDFNAAGGALNGEQTSPNRLRLRSTEDLLEEIGQRLNLVEETREEFLNLHMPQVQNPNRSRGNQCSSRCRRRAGAQ